eukprot:comp19467_c0_seq1/m.22661 comp19467_c0_seq1/g.22661  ORF comp19467_c0_seq1/g.22661 comp19467_c0_seq1/m.22661 type:complete len:926 (-) comp19467_c0_seq1:100-2877(-)
MALLDTMLTTEQLKKDADILQLKDFYNADMARYASWRSFLQAARQHDVEQASTILEVLSLAEGLWGRPGPEKMHTLKKSIQNRMWQDVLGIAEDVLGRFAARLESDLEEAGYHKKDVEPHFDVLFVQNSNNLGNVHCDIALELSKVEKKGDPLRYASVSVSTFEDAIVAVLYNHDIQSVVFTTDFTARSPMSYYRKLMTVDGQEKLQGLNLFIDQALEKADDGVPLYEILARTLLQIRPELDLFFVCEYGAPDEGARTTARIVRRVFAAMDDHTELHLAILSGVQARVSTPFFDALVAYSKRPVGVFHALAISRGHSVLKSRWIQKLVEFYGRNLFKAESSSTCGGLDSLLDPHGTLKQAQAKAAEAFLAQHTYFVTNGTSTANKICGQALLQPGDIVIIDRDCHKSHHYGIILSGALPCYVDAYPLHEYSMYGGVPLRALKKALLDYRRCGLLHKVKLVILTNCTFDGIVYNVRRVMEEMLAIKPDLVFLWDEAWYAYATFNPIMRTRTGMGAARDLEASLDTMDFRLRYLQFKDSFGELDGASEEKILEARLVPDPEAIKVRVYVTQSTHKALTSLRQGSMIHVHDQLFEKEVEHSFHEAFFTHTSTSPNYQILASLDVGRRQMQLEGFQFVNDAIENAYALRKYIASHQEVSRFFSFLDVEEMVPKEFRQSSSEETFYKGGACVRLEHWWLSDDEFVLDPTRLTLYVGQSGLEGEEFKVKWLMDKYDIQVNKTSRNSVLFQTHIGSTHSASAYLLQCLSRAASELRDDHDQSSKQELKMKEKKIRGLTTDAPPLPNFSHFHRAFRTHDGGTPEGNMRDAFFMCYDEDTFDYVSVSEALEQIRGGKELVATTFIIPYPPGFPILVPGQVVTKECLEFLIKLDVKEIHGLDTSLGLRVFTDAALERKIAENAKEHGGNKRIRLE